MKTQTTKALVLVAIAAGFVLAGCELIVDFDRTKIPVESVDSGSADAEALSDGEVIIGDGGVAPSLDGAAADASDASDASEPVDASDGGDGG